MNITCQHCQTPLNIPDHKLPKDKNLAIRCPNCREKIQIPAIGLQPKTEDEKKKPARFQFDDRLNAIVCTNRSELQHKMLVLLDRMGMNTEIADDMRVAFSKMEYRIYHLLILDDGFDRENKGVAGIIERMTSLDMSLRRRICMVLISRRFNTNDKMAALHTSVNNVIHQEDLGHMESFLTLTLQEHQNLYAVYNESLKLAGKA